MRVAYMTCEGNLATSKERRVDSYEHDLEFNAMRPAFLAHGDELFEVDWRTFDPQHHAADLIFIRTVYDYTKHVDEFQKFLDKASSATIVANLPEIIRWNMDKHYLNDLSSRGLPIIESMFLDKPLRLADIFAGLTTDEIVVKPVVGSSGLGQVRYHKNKCDPDMIISREMFIQPFMDAIMKSGEISMVFINGHYSHGLIKKCSSGEYRIHKEYGGTEEAYRPSAADIELASRFVEALPAKPLACRVDLIRDGEKLFLMELEAQEPFLFPQHRPDFGEHIYAACKDFIRKD
jgi:glutathione synthase/RimK-type ligase-like ATP-grasp enzyme